MGGLGILLVITYSKNLHTLATILFMIALYIISGYLFFVFVFLRLITPNLGFRVSPVPEKIPEHLEKVIQDLNSRASDDEDYLFKTYEYVTKRFVGNRPKTVTQFWKAFQDPLKQKDGFLHCMGQNFILRTMLIKSGRFREQDVKVKTEALHIFIHQYLLVHIGDCKMQIDPWKHFLGKGIAQIA